MRMTKGCHSPWHSSCCSNLCHATQCTTDQLIELMLNIPFDTKQVILMLFPVNLLARTETHTQLFYGSPDFVQHNPGEPVPEETFTHSPLSWSSIMLYVLPPSSMIHGVFSVQFACLTVFFHNLSLLYLLAWHSPFHTPYISSPNHCLLFAARAHTIASKILKLGSIRPLIFCFSCNTAAAKKT